MKPPGRSVTAKLRLALAAAAALLPLVPSAAVAQVTQAPIVHVGDHEQSVARKIDLSIGRSIVIDLPRDAKEVFVANPKIANAVVRSTRKVFLIGMADGYTSMFVMDAAGRQIAALEITVGRDLSLLRETLRRAMPEARIEIRPAGDSVLLTGLVDSPLQAQQAVDIANAFVGQSGGGGADPAAGGGGAAPAGLTTGKVINSITIRGRDQVMLKVTVAEMQRNILKQLGVDISGNWRVGDTVFNAAISNAFPVSTTQPDSFLRIGTNNATTIRAMERAGVVRTLAEPTLTAISGETAKFLVGGEVPLLTGITCQGGPGIGCTQSIELKPFGVQLTFTPIVLSEQRISIRVATEVSEIDTSISINQGNGSIPGFRVRRSETTVELPSGGSLVTAGLLQQSSRQSMNGLPGLINLPILGTLFRSRDYQRQETELMISVTPFIAKPVAAGDIVKPDDGFIDASDPQAVLLGRLNKLYGVTGTPVKKRGYHGHVGFITD